MLPLLNKIIKYLKCENINNSFFIDTNPARAQPSTYLFQVFNEGHNRLMTKKVQSFQNVEFLNFLVWRTKQKDLESESAHFFIYCKIPCPQFVELPHSKIRVGKVLQT